MAQDNPATDETLDAEAAQQQMYTEMMQQMELAYEQLDQNRRELDSKLKELQQTKEFADTVLQTILDGIVVVDRTGKIERANAAALRLFRLDAGGMVGKKARGLLPDELPMDAAKLPYEGETVVRGTPVLVNAAAVMDIAQRHTGTVVVLKDITRIKAFEATLEEELAKLRAELGGKQKELELQVKDLESAREDLERTNAELGAERERIRTQAERTQRAAVQIAGASREHESMAAQLTTAVTEVATSLQELSQTAEQVAEHVGGVAKSAEDTSTAALEGQELMERLVEEVSVIKDGSASIAERIGRLSARSQEISRILDLIEHVADRTDLLALNAAIEGAHAGAAGRGFGVVAAEMRRLAENVSQHAGEIKRVIEEVQSAIRASVLATEDGIKRTDQGGVIAEKAGTAFRDILDRIQRTTEAAQLIRVATQQQRSGTSQMVQAMDDIRDAADKTLDATRQTTRALNEMTGHGR